MDPSKTTVTTRVTALSATQSSVDRWIQYKAFTNETIANWHLTATWSHDGHTVQVLGVRAFITDKDSWVRDNGSTTGSAYGVGRGNAQVWGGGNIDVCALEVGCFENDTPGMQFTLGSNGSYHLDRQDK